MRLALFLCALIPAVALAATSSQGNSAPASATAAFPIPTNAYKVPFPKVDTSGLSPDVAAEVRKGEYLVKLSDCMACHTDHERGKILGKPFAGGLPMPTAFGVIFTRNITPDTETGIGDWTFDEFDKAVRYGLSPWGYLFAAMPYNYYNIMSKAQVRDIWEYLKRVPAVHRKDKPVNMPPPFKWRWLQVGWRILFFKPIKDAYHYDPKHPYDPDRSKAWNRGHFIVNGPAHCGDCHTAHSLLGSPQKAHALSGTGFSGSWAPNIGSAVTGVHSIKTITRVFRKAKGLAGGELREGMLDAISNSLSYMTPADMRAVAIYIQSVNGSPASGPTPAPLSEVSLARGQKTFQADCASCHTSGIGGAPKVGNVQDWKALSREPFLVLFQNVWHGVSIMPPKGGCDSCSSRDITSAIAYMLKQSQPGARSTLAEQGGATASGGQGNLPRNEVSVALGEKIYHAHCAACHAGGLYGAPRYGDKSEWAPRLALGLNTLHQNALDGIGAMPPKGGCADCSKDQILSAVDYIVAGSGGKSMVQAKTQDGGN